MNLYADLNDAKTHLGLTGTSNDAELLRLLEVASREVDGWTRRFFYSQTATRIYDAIQSGALLLPDDLLSVTTLKTDTDGDQSFDDETWVEGSDFYLEPFNEFPKDKIVVIGDGDFVFTAGPRTVQIAGIWGHGDGLSATPWADAGITGTVATTTGTSLTVSAATVYAGDTILIGTEQMYISAISGTSATVTRGVNGTTAATHNAAAISTAKYPAQLIQATLALTGEAFRSRGQEGFESERIGDYSYSRGGMAGDLSVYQRRMDRMLGPLRRLAA